MTSKPLVADLMTAMPITVRVDQSIERAHELMERHRIRHLPVVEVGQLVGVLSDRELDVALEAPGIDPNEVPVAGVMETDVLTVSPDDPVDEVALKMVERRVGSAVVVRRGDLVGIFTTIDALRALESTPGV